MIIQQDGEEEEGIIFQLKQSNIVEEKLCQKQLNKWGLDKQLKIFSFNFNQKYEDLDRAKFISNIFSSNIVRQSISLQLPSNLSTDEIKYQNINCTLTDLTIFDKLVEEKIVVNNIIKQCLPEYIDDIEIGDLLRQTLLMEESEHYTIFSEEERKELLFELFKILCIGGQLNQYESQLSPYLEWTKYLYKNIVSVKKDNQNIFVESYVYEILDIKGCYSSQNNDKVYIVINPSLREVKVITNILYKNF